MFHSYEGVNYLQPQKLKVWLGTSGELCVSPDGEKTYQHVKIFRTRPISAPNKYLSFRVGHTKTDQEELGILIDLKPLPAFTRALIENELDKRYFIHQISSIQSIKEELGVLYWKVNTDKGYKEFSLSRRFQTPIISIKKRGRLITDVNGNRYIIPDLNLLDSKSRLEFLRHINC